MTRRVACAAVWMLMAGLLGGCAGLPFLSKGKHNAAGATPVLVERAAYELEVNAPGDLRQLLLSYLDLARFQSAPETESINGAELARLVAAAPAQARALLETEGYFNAEVRVSRVPGNETTLRIRVDVVPGPRTVVGKWSVDVIGDLQKSVQVGEEAAVVELAALRRRWPLKVDDPFRQAAWANAKNSTMARLRAEGYPSANWDVTNAQVDALTHTAQTKVVADSGPLFRLGAITIEGLQRYDEVSVRRLATFYPGQPYDEQLMLDYQDRLQKVGLFEGAVVEIDPDPAHAKATPVTVRVKEQQLQSATAGVGYSANTGARLTLEHVHRKVFGQPWIASNKFELGSSLKSWQTELTSHPKTNFYRNLLSGYYERLETTDELRTSWTARVGRTQDTPHVERLYFAEFTHSRLDTVAGTNNSDAVSANYHWVWRRVDNLLLPVKGFALSVQGALGVAAGREITTTGVTNGRGPFSRLYSRLHWYRPLPGSWNLTTRLEAGQVFAPDHVGLPDTLLFRAGGDESVRGYAFRSLGPEVNGAIVSGRVLASGSVEVARPISAKRPQFQWALFIDAGRAANHWTELDPAVGYGAGLRWRSPVGPLRLDLAYGEELRKFRLHMSVGISF